MCSLLNVSHVSAYNATRCIVTHSVINICAFIILVP